MTPRLLISLCLLLSTTARVKAGDFFYVLVFGSQQEWPNPRYSHSFATFVKATGTGEFPDTIEEIHTISWLPATMVVRPALLPERGENFGLHQTIRWCLDNCMRVSLWGPFEIDEDLYCRALKQIAVLESGRVRYKPVDSGYPTNRVSNCIHAVSSVAGGYRARIGSPEWGETASWYLARRLRPWYLNPAEKQNGSALSWIWISIPSFTGT
jgi:hypothetical protein